MKWEILKKAEETYLSLEECLEKVNYLLSHDSQREEIARKGQLRTLKSHTAMHRARQIDGLIRATMR